MRLPQIVVVYIWQQVDQLSNFHSSLDNYHSHLIVSGSVIIYMRGVENEGWRVIFVPRLNEVLQFVRPFGSNNLERFE